MIHGDPRTLDQIHELEERVIRCRRECWDLPGVCEHCDDLLRELNALKRTVPRQRDA